VLALRMHDVPGDRIGQVVAEVESHVAESGEDPVDAFGSPPAYAERIRATLGPPPRRRPGAVVAATVTVVAVVLALQALAALTGDGRVAVTAGVVVAVGLVVAAATLLVPLLARPMWQFVAAYAVAAPAATGALALLDEPVLVTVPAWAALVVAVLVGVAGFVLVRRLSDPIVEPRVTTEPAAGVAPPEDGRRT
jgi:hypothetical protein